MPLYWVMSSFMIIFMIFIMIMIYNYKDKEVIMFEYNVSEVFNKYMW